MMAWYSRARSSFNASINSLIWALFEASAGLTVAAVLFLSCGILGHSHFQFGSGGRWFDLWLDAERPKGVASARELAVNRIVRPVPGSSIETARIQRRQLKIPVSLVFPI